MTKLSSIALDPEASARGRWVPYVLDVRLLIARAGGQRFREATRRAIEARVERRGGGDLDEADRDEVTCEVLAGHVLLGWEGIDDDETGAPLPYSREAAVKLLSDPRLEPLREFVDRYSSRHANYMAQRGN